MYTHSKFSASAKLLYILLLVLYSQNVFASEQLPSLPAIGIESGGAAASSTQDKQKVIAQPPVESDGSFMNTGTKKLPKAEILDTSDNAEPLVLPDMKSSSVAAETTETQPTQPSDVTSASMQQPVETIDKAPAPLEAKAINADTNISQNADHPEAQPKAQDMPQNNVSPSTTTSAVQQPLPTAPQPTPTATTVVAQPTKPTVVPVSNETQNKGDKVVSRQKLPSKAHKSAQNDKATTLTAEHEQFIKNEIVMLMLDDDTAPGMISGMTRADDDDITPNQYIKLFWNDYHYYHPTRVMQRYAMESFISERPNSYARNAPDNEELQKQLFEVVAQGSISDVRSIIDNYPLLQIRDGSGRNMLSIAAMGDDISVARFLLLRGIDLYALDYAGNTAFSFAAMTKNHDMLNLLKSAITSQ